MSKVFRVGLTLRLRSSLIFHIAYRMRIASPTEDGWTTLRIYTVTRLHHLYYTETLHKCMWLCIRENFVKRWVPGWHKRVTVPAEP